RVATQLWKSPWISSWLTHPEEFATDPNRHWPPRLFAAGADRRQLHLDMRFGPCPSRRGLRSIFQLVLSRNSTTALATFCCSSSVSGAFRGSARDPCEGPSTTLSRRSSALLHMAPEWNEKRHSQVRSFRQLRGLTGLGPS